MPISVMTKAELLAECKRIAPGLSWGHGWFSGGRAEADSGPVRISLEPQADGQIQAHAMLSVADRSRTVHYDSHATVGHALDAIAAELRSIAQHCSRAAVACDS